MKKILTLLLLVSSVILNSCKKDPNNAGVLSPDKNVFFTLSYNGKTLTQYGTKSTDINDTGIKFYASAQIVKDGNPNESDIYIMVLGTSGNPIIVGNHNLTATMHINKVGVRLGIYNNILGSISDGDVLPTISYFIDKANCVITITNIDSEYIAGNFSFYIYTDKLVPATGSFKLNKL